MLIGNPRIASQRKGIPLSSLAPKICSCEYIVDNKIMIQLTDTKFHGPALSPLLDHRKHRCGQPRLCQITFVFVHRSFIHLCDINDLVMAHLRGQEKETYHSSGIKDTSFKMSDAQRPSWLNICRKTNLLMLTFQHPHDQWISVIHIRVEGS